MTAAMSTVATRPDRRAGRRARPIPAAGPSGTPARGGVNQSSGAMPAVDASGARVTMAGRRRRGTVQPVQPALQAPHGHAAHRLEHDRPAHLARAEAPLDEGDRHLRGPLPRLDGPERQLDLEAVSLA